MEVHYQIDITCDISDIEGHGVEREIEVVRQALKDASISGISHCISAYRIDRVIRTKT